MRVPPLPMLPLMAHRPFLSATRATPARPFPCALPGSVHFSPPDTAPCPLRRRLRGDITPREPAVRKRPARGHHPCVDVLALDPAHRDDATVSIPIAPPRTRPSALQCDLRALGSRNSRRPASASCPATPARSRRVDAVKANPRPAHRRTHSPPPFAPHPVSSFRSIASGRPKQNRQARLGRATSPGWPLNRRP